jgi:hypothetical protein
MKNVVLKTCLTTLVLAMSGLAAADSTQEQITAGIAHVTTFESQSGPLAGQGYSAIAGGALSVAAESLVTGNVAAVAAVTIGAEAALGAYDHINYKQEDFAFEKSSSVSAGAAVTIAAGAKVGNIYAAAAAGVAANADVGNIQAFAAVTLGAPSTALDIKAGAAITLGAGSFASDVQAAAAITGAVVKQDIDGNDVPGGNVNSMIIANIADTNDAITDMHAFDIDVALTEIKAVQGALSGLPTENYPSEPLLTSMVDGDRLAEGVYEGSALNIPADSTIFIDGDVIINLSDALTLGANTKIIAGENTVIWNIGSGLNLGAGTKFTGTAFVNGSVSGATADICGNGSLYAAGAVAIGSIGKDCPAN